jgi:hypothetical protein
MRFEKSRVPKQPAPNVLNTALIHVKSVKDPMDFKGTVSVLCIFQFYAGMFYLKDSRIILPFWLYGK